MAETLRIQASEMRLKRRQRTEEFGIAGELRASLRLRSRRVVGDDADDGVPGLLQHADGVGQVVLAPAFSAQCRAGAPAAPPKQQIDVLISLLSSSAGVGVLDDVIDTAVLVAQRP
jgi:hypothetical protein